ncbi:hypothetical protein MNBD_BACTEROID06-1305, partial [hydrothermal vent metagenome]
MSKKVYSLFIFFLVFSSGFAQNITSKGQFLKDSVQIGEPIEFALSIKYPKELELIFPDSLYNFFPFELTKKIYFPTKSDSVFSVDSAIYYLSTFEIDSIQYLKMPVYKVNEFDSLIIWTLQDSIILQHAVESIPDSVAMVTNTNYMEVPMAFNYPYASIALIILIVITVILWFVFGKTVTNKIQIYRLKKRNLKFIETFDNLVTNNFLNTEEILILWKNYLEKLNGEPFTKLTTTEIVSLLKYPNVETALMAIDKNIYGPKDDSLLSDAYQTIKDIAQNEYTNKV